MGRAAQRIQTVSILVTVVALLLLARALPLDALTTALRAWVAALGIWGPLAFAGVYVVATVLFLPGLVLTLAAGAIFGLFTGFVTVSIGSTLGAGAAFLVARYLARERVARAAADRPRFRAIDRAIAVGGWRIVALLRLSPAVPFNLQNYLFGLTPVGFWAYLSTSWIAMMPGTFLYVYLGAVTGAAVGGARERSGAEWALLAVGLLATIAVTVYVTRLARRQLAAVADLEEGPPAASPAARRGSTFGAVAAAVVAALAVAAAAWASRNPETLAAAFGPPRIALQESYGEGGGTASFDHDAFDRLLAAHVDADGWVDYAALAKEEPALDRYLARLGDAPFEELDRDAKLALLINAYNAFTLKLILDHWPVESIKDIPEGERWKARRWKLAGRTFSLDDIEHEEIRGHFREPRIHFALVCAAVGCPPLRPEAYTAARLDEQLEGQTRYVHGKATWFGFDAPAGRVFLTPLYDWYGDDFAQVAGSPVAYAARYAPPLAAALARGETPKPSWLDYDWSLNDVANRRPR